MHKFDTMTGRKHYSYKFKLSYLIKKYLVGFFPEAMKERFKMILELLKGGFKPLSDKMSLQIHL